MIYTAKNRKYDLIMYTNSELERNLVMADIKRFSGNPDSVELGGVEELDFNTEYALGEAVVTEHGVGEVIGYEVKLGKVIRYMVVVKECKNFHMPIDAGRPLYFSPFDLHRVVVR